eukprot:EG_transcript_41821
MGLLALLALFLAVTGGPLPPASHLQVVPQPGPAATTARTFPSQPAVSRRMALVASGVAVAGLPPRRAEAIPVEECQALCVKECTIVAPGNDEYCTNACATYCETEAPKMGAPSAADDSVDTQASEAFGGVLDRLFGSVGQFLFGAR